MRLEPGFYAVDINVLVNLNTWKRMNDSQRKILTDAALWLEDLDKEHIAMSQEERDRQAKAGISVVRASETRFFGFPFWHNCNEVIGNLIQVVDNVLEPSKAS